jgi:Cu2+-exporting ATPase
LDKTGTLTDGTLDVQAFYGDASVRPLVEVLETQSSHPIAVALSGGSRDRTLDASIHAELVYQGKRGIIGKANGRTLVIGSEAHVRQSIGELPAWAIAKRQALTAAGLTPIWVGCDGAMVALYGLGNHLRDDAKVTMEGLRRMGLHLVILSGDDPDTVSAVGARLGLAAGDCHGGLSPEEKTKRVEKAAHHGQTFMVGDGVNDAAAFSAASVGIAVHGGAEASLLAADVCLMRPGLTSLIQLFSGAKRTLGVIRLCIVVSLVYNVFAATLAISGRVHPILAAVLMPLASFTVLAIALWSRTFSTFRQRAL